MEHTPSSTSSVRTKKRKLEDAIRTLDAAVTSPSLAATLGQPTPSKRPHLTRSVYSTLAKFSGTSQERSRTPSNDMCAIDVSKSAPRLAAILARSVPRPKQVVPLSHLSASPVHPTSDYRPSSMDSFLSRLATYKITTFSNKPPQIDAVAAVRCGWINNGKDRLVCGICSASWVLAGREGMNKDAASALIEKQCVSLVEMHKDGCPWKARQCEPSVYRVPLQAPTALVRELRATALSLEPILANVAIRHPLTPSQLSSLRSICCIAASERSSSEHDSIRSVGETTHHVVPSDTAIIVALFGWLAAPMTPFHRTSFASCAELSAPSASMPPTPSLSRTSSISSHFRERTSTPTPPASMRMSISQFNTSPDRMRPSLHTKNTWTTNVTTIPASQDTAMVYCVLCQRRVGLWGYPRSQEPAPSVQGERPASSCEHQKEFDLVKEHRSYCPYIVRSSVVPSFAHSPSVNSSENTVEGWRAVLTVIQRYELGQRQHLSRFLASDDPDNQASSTELKGVEAMVAGVKTNGGRELLRYVKTLLG